VTLGSGLPAILCFLYFLSIANKIQHYTIFFITVNALHVQAVSPPIIRSPKTVHTASGICEACLLLPLAVAASKLDTYPMLCVQFLGSWWWAEKPPETCRALTVIKNIVYNVVSYWLYLKITLKILMWFWPCIVVNMWK